MLVLSRKTGESILIGTDIRVTVTHLKGLKVKIGVEAPKGMVVLREELTNESGGCSVQSTTGHDGNDVGLESLQCPAANACSPRLKKTGKACKKAGKAVKQP